MKIKKEKELKKVKSKSKKVERSRRTMSVGDRT
jgi:hypothetical protein